VSNQDLARVRVGQVVEVVRGTKSSDTVLLVLGDECWFWNSRASYQTKSDIQLGVGSMTGDRID
jgi:hypothetical protein